MYKLWIIETIVLVFMCIDNNCADPNFSMMSKNETSVQMESSTSRNSFLDLEVWSTTRRPQLRSYRRNLRLKKYGLHNRKHQDRAEKRHRAKAARRMAMALTYSNNRRLVEDKKVRKRRKKHNSRVALESRRSPYIINILPENISKSVNTVNNPLRERGDEDEDKTNANGTAHKEQLSPYSILMQINQKIVPKLEALDANVSVEVLGRTLEYNDIVLVKASSTGGKSPKRFRTDDRFDESTPEKKIIVIVHGLSVMGFNRLPCLKTMEGLTKLMSYYYEHLDKFDIYVIPMANPDGVAAAASKNYWNKNVSPQSACPGVFLDRNFDVAWNSSATLVSSCSQLFPGVQPFTELETQVIRDIFHKYSNRIIGYFHVHTSTYSSDTFKGDGVLYPKGYTDVSVDDDRYIDLKGEIDEVMKNVSFKFYSVAVETLYTWYGKISGSSVDFANTVYGIPYAMEFAMQLYDDDKMVEKPVERETAVVLSEVWKRVIDVIFENIYKTVKISNTK